MNISYFHHGLEVTEKDKNYIEKRLAAAERIAAKEGLRSIVKIARDKRGTYAVDVTFSLPRHAFLASANAGTIEGAVDLVEEELKQQIRSHKEKRTTLIRRGARSIKKKLTIDDAARF